MLRNAVDVLAEKSKGRWALFKQSIANGILEVCIGVGLVGLCIWGRFIEGSHFLEYVVMEDIVISPGDAVEGECAWMRCRRAHSSISSLLRAELEVGEV